MNQETTTPSGGGYEEWISRLRAAQSRRNTAKRSITLLVIGVFVLFAALLWGAVNDFQARQPEFAAAIAEEAAMLSPRFAQDTQDMLNRLYPVYVESFQDVMERDWDKIQAEAVRQTGLLDAYAKEKWPLIQDEIAALAISAESSCREEFSSYLSDEEARAVCMSYGAALEKKSEEILQERFSEHFEVAASIGGNLELLLKTEPDIQEAPETPVLLGIMLELAGIELQKGL